MINWKLRLQNKVTLVSLILAIIELAYFVLDAFGVIPKIPQETIVKISQMVIGILSLVGIVVDPTTKGFGDSDRVMQYVAPGTTTILD